MSQSHRVVLALGGNMGDVPAHFASALHEVTRQYCTLIACSALYRTPPWGKTDQPDFLNMAAHLTTSLSAHELLAVCLKIEQSHGRQRGEKWGPRTLDLDIIDFDGCQMQDADLTLPHPRAHERAFVLVPMAEIAPEVMLGAHNVAWYKAHCDQTGIKHDTSASANFLRLLMLSLTS